MERVAEHKSRREGRGINGGFDYIPDTGNPMILIKNNAIALHSAPLNLLHCRARPE